VHTEQAVPPVPHAPLTLPVLHTLPWQQPLHVAGEQEPASLHAPPWHTCDEVQMEQGLPRLPHAPPVLPGLHWLPWQQPEGQVVWEQVPFLAHLPPVQICPDEHALHFAPLSPHFLADWATTQLPLLSQQPPHVLGPQAALSSAAV